MIAHQVFYQTARAVGRGEIDLAKITPRIKSLPFDLLRHDVMVTFKPISKKAIYEIITRFFYRWLSRSRNRNNYGAIIYAMIHKIEINPKQFKMGFYIGVGQVKKGEA